MKITVETSLENFDAWSGAKDTLKRLIELDLCEDAEFMIDEIYPDGLTDTQLNDILRFESDWLFDALGVEEEN
jgi:hypothetical protein